MRVQYSRLAEPDLEAIAQYTVDQFGVRQAQRYLADIESRGKQLAAHPLMGRACDEIRDGLRRFEQGSHVLFYLQQDRGIFVARILHKSMLPEEQAFDAPG